MVNIRFAIKMLNLNFLMFFLQVFI